MDDVPDRRVGWSPWRIPLRVCLVVGALMSCVVVPFYGVHGAVSSARDLADLPIDRLMQIEVTTPGKKSESLSQTPAAVHVVTAEDIRRSGATSIPEALRGVPGLHVARLDSQAWAVSARGFNDEYANKLLVMIDGRSIYTPVFSGTLWDMRDTFIEDVERIEVVRGPGATLWGANAVNGVINVITKSAEETQGTLVTGGGGTFEGGFGGIRHGGRLNENTAFRVYSKYFYRNHSVLSSGDDAYDAWQTGRTGFRMDWSNNDRTRATLQGDLFIGQLNQRFRRAQPTPPFTAYLDPDQIDIAGGNLLGRFTHDFSEDSELTIQSYYDRTYRDAVVIREDRQTFDLDVQHRFHPAARHEIVWGVGYRISADDLKDSFDVAFDPNERTTDLFSSFVQDEIELLDPLSLTLGSKVSYTEYTELELQPSARLLWTPSDRHTFWGAISRAVRTPSRAENDIRLNQPNGPPGTVVSLFGSRDFDSEVLVAYELGYRTQLHPSLSVDIATFFNDYDELRSIEPLQPPFRPAPPPPHVPFMAGNELKAESYGLEVGTTYRLTEWWEWKGTYSFLNLDLSRKSGGRDAMTAALVEGSNPEHEVSLWSQIDLPRGWEWDVRGRMVDALPAHGIDRYFALDMRVGWRPLDDLEVSVVGQNLLDSHHPEFAPSFIPTERAEIPRSVFGKLTWHF